VSAQRSEAYGISGNSTGGAATQTIGDQLPGTIYWQAFKLIGALPILVRVAVLGFIGSKILPERHFEGMALGVAAAMFHPEAA
jgi:hypothetical protein